MQACIYSFIQAISIASLQVHSSTHSFIHSFILNIYIAPLQENYSEALTTAQRRSRLSTDTVPEFRAEAPQATVSEGLSQGPYVVARGGVEPITLRTKGVDSTKAPHTPQQVLSIFGLVLI